MSYLLPIMLFLIGILPSVYPITPISKRRTTPISTWIYMGLVALISCGIFYEVYTAEVYKVRAIARGEKDSLNLETVIAEGKTRRVIDSIRYDAVKNSSETNERLHKDAATRAEERQKKLDDANAKLAYSQQQTIATQKEIQYAIFLANHDAFIPGEVQSDAMEWLERVEKAKPRKSILPKKFNVIVNSRPISEYDNLVIAMPNENGGHWEIRIDPAKPNMHLWRALTEVLLEKPVIRFEVDEHGGYPKIDKLLYQGFEPFRYTQAPEWVKDIYWEEMLYELGPYQDDYPPFLKIKQLYGKKINAFYYFMLINSLYPSIFS